MQKNTSENSENFENFLINGLNKPQREAVEKNNCAILVTAGAGSGKTRVITARISHLLKNLNAPSDSIIALTFTNKAAKEMSERVNRMAGDVALPFVGTFHSFCFSLLRKYGSMIGCENFSIMDSDDQSALVKRILKRNGLEKMIPANRAFYEISRCKNDYRCNDEVTKIYPFLNEVADEYEKEKKNSKSLDFDDLLLKVVDLFKASEEFSEKFESKVRHVLVDEYQDTNFVQHDLLKFMSRGILKRKFEGCSVCIVGDEDQSIYSWRGAVVENMRSFKEDFAPVTVVKLEQNYRSSQPILSVANKLISNNANRIQKSLWSEKKSNSNVLSIICRSSLQESDTIVSLIEGIPEKDRSSTAILYRTHFQSRLVEETLIRESVPYRLVGGLRFYERKEIKDLLAFLRLIVNPFDKASFFRIMNVPSRGLGSKFEEIVDNYWRRNPFLEVSGLLNSIKNESSLGLTKLHLEGINELIFILNLNQSDKPHKLMEQVLERTCYKEYLKESYDEKEARNKRENVDELKASIKYFERTGSSQSDPFEDSKKDVSLKSFLYEVSLIQEKMESKESSGCVNLMTLHSAKGLEFDTVAIVGLEEGLLPSSKSLASTADLDEERRLFYVGITRTKKKLLFTRSITRDSFYRTEFRDQSRFLREISGKPVEEVDVSNMKSFQLKNVIHGWHNGMITRQPSVMTFSRPSGPSKFAKPATRIAYSNKKDALNNSPWKIHAPVSHKIFGIGTVKSVERKDSEEYYVTVAFKTGVKKIVSSFLKSV